MLGQTMEKRDIEENTEMTLYILESRVKYVLQ